MAVQQPEDQQALVQPVAIAQDDGLVPSWAELFRVTLALTFIAVYWTALFTVARCSNQHIWPPLIAAAAASLLVALAWGWGWACHRRGRLWAWPLAALLLCQLCGTGTSMLRLWAQHGCAFDADLSMMLRLHVPPVAITGASYFAALMLGAGQAALLEPLVHAASEAYAVLHLLSFVRLRGDATWQLAALLAVVGAVGGPFHWTILAPSAWWAAQKVTPVALHPYLTQLWHQGLLADAYPGLQTLRRDALGTWDFCAIIGSAVLEIHFWQVLR